MKSLFGSIFLIVILFCSFFSLSVSSRTIFDNLSPEDLNKNTLSIIQSLNPPEGFSVNKEATLASRRFHQYLILKEKKVTDDLEVSFVKDYLESTKPCLTALDGCLNNTTENKKFISSFYTFYTIEVLEELSNAITSPPPPITSENKTSEQTVLNSSMESLSPRQITVKGELNNFKRAKFLNLAYKSLELGVHEVDGSNDDSLSGGDLIKQYFEATGIKHVEREMTNNKVDEWAWCAAFITSLYNQSGGGFSFITQEEYIRSCREMDKKSHCHPVQVDFILNWARRKAKVSKFSESVFSEIIPGDLLVLINPKSGQASHIGIYVAQSKDCSAQDIDECWVYTIEGNAGPFINDALEEEWPQVKRVIHKNNIEDADYERLLDRLTLVKRPAANWDYAINLFD
ncbi:MAG: hypothetical protein SFU25_00080 [Candidatus Caenarcaniphilales bacterium]|nr:hypothetical protein [Candidatus Caenarcaniphilales bacterium]